ncbi:MAG: DUF1634 domain-containing protein [Candidatus Korobacteraceae bacterium]|jgi:uncharacterized membrane protein
MSSLPHKSPPPDDWNDRRIELIIGTLLRIGVLFSAIVVLIGGIIYLFRHGLATASYRTFEGELSPLRSLPGIGHGVLQLSGRAIIQFGLLLLIATPVARVVFSAVAFARERDYLYVAFTLAVLAILGYSLVGAHLG